MAEFIDSSASASSKGVDKFRQTAKNFFLTYPKWNYPVGKETATTREVAEAFVQQFAPVHYCVAKEHHQDGTIHFHVLCSYSRKLNIKSPKHWDFWDNHGNYQVAKNQQDVLTYIQKDGDYISNYDDFIIDSVPYGKRQKVFLDWKWSKQFKEDAKRLPVQWGVVVKDWQGNSFTLEAPDAAKKCRSLWLVAKPNAGKTWWLNRTFANQKVYITSNCKYIYEGYDEEQLIVCDDRVPKFEECANVLNVYSIKAPVYGDVRYCKQHWPINVARSMLVLSNKTMQECYGQSDIVLQAMYARFREVIDVQFNDVEIVE